MTDVFAAMTDVFVVLTLAAQKRTPSCALSWIVAVRPRVHVYVSVVATYALWIQVPFAKCSTSIVAA